MPSLVIDGELYPGEVSADTVQAVVSAICEKLEVAPKQCGSFTAKKKKRAWDLEFVAPVVAFVVGWCVLSCVCMCYGCSRCRKRFSREASYKQGEI